MKQKDEFKFELNRFGDFLESMPWLDQNFYENYLAQTYYYVRHGTRLLALAASKFSFEREAFHRRFLKHVGEEINHELLLINDLKQLGKDINEFDEMPQTRCFYELQFSKIDRVGPSSFLGYIICLEGAADLVGESIYSIVKEKYGPKATTFIKVHSAEDPEHIEQAFKILDSLQDIEKEEIFMGLRQAIFLFEAMLDVCKESILSYDQAA